jgi:hypothetical protein
MSINPTVAAAIDQQNHRLEVESWFADRLAEGYDVSEHGFRLGLKQEDVTLLTGAFVLAKEAAAIGMPVPPIIDAEGRPHTLTIEQLTAVMLGYGHHRASLSAEYASRLDEARQ